MSKTRFRFNNKGLDRLPPQRPDAASSNYEISDEGEVGLRLAVFKSGRKSWRFRYTFEGDKGTVTYGTYPAVSIDQARELVRQSKKLMASGIDPRQEKHERREALSFAEFVEQEYLPFAERERRSLRDIKSRLKAKIIPVFGKKRLHQIHNQEIRSFIDKLAMDVSGTTANRTKSLLSAIFRMAVELGHIKENPARGIAKRKENGPRTRYMNDQEVARFLPVLLDEVGKGNMSAQVIYTLFLSGLRRSEVMAMRWENLDLDDRGTLFIPCPKNGQPRTVPLNSLAIGILKDIRVARGDHGAYVFPAPSASGHVTDIRKTLATLKKRAEIHQNLTTHDLRRGFSSMLANCGEDLRTIGDLIGHKDIKTTQRVYAHLASNTLRRASEKIVTKVEELLTPHAA